MDHKALAALLFPENTATPADLETQYPPRQLAEGAKVTRMAPSPTGFMHLGNLFGAIADERLAHQSGGVFYLRIEDTDQKRAVEGGVQTIVDVFASYQLPFDEGATATGEFGTYGPYYQQKRKTLYHICAKWLVGQGRAYPCFLTEEELAAMHDEQAACKANFGCYGPYARYRNTELDEIKQRIAAGQRYVIRYRSEGSLQNRIKFTDLVRGTLELPENDQDVVLLKADGIPTYHFAHVVDDHFMRTSHVIRGEEWLATLPIHLQLFAAMGWKPPKYLHTAQLMKREGSSKRKLSKRKDPELALDFYSEQGYPIEAVKEYLLVLLNSNFEDWRLQNPQKPLNDFPFSIKKMGVSGALFDLAKLNDVSRNTICQMDAAEVYGLLVRWAARYDAPFAALLEANMPYATAILNIGRCTPKRRKDLTTWGEAKAYLNFFYDELFTPDYTLPEGVQAAEALQILTAYNELYQPAGDANEWFATVKQLAQQLGYAAGTKEYKQNPAGYKGHVGQVSMVLRIALTGRQNSPDLYEVTDVMGEAMVHKRLAGAIAHYEGL